MKTLSYFEQCLARGDKLIAGKLDETPTEFRALFVFRHYKNGHLFQVGRRIPAEFRSLAAMQGWVDSEVARHG